MKTAQKLPRFGDAVRRHARVILPRLTVRRILNLSRLWLDMKRRTINVSSKPIIAKIEASNNCGLKCLGCRSGDTAITYPAGNIAPDLFLKILDELGDYLFEIIFYLWGEPTMNRNLPNLIKSAHKKNISVSVSTNLHYLGEDFSRSLIQSGLDKMIAAIDGFSQESYESVRRGGNFKLALENLERFVRIKKEMKSKKPLIEWQYVVTDMSINEIEQAEKFASGSGIDRFVLLQDWAGRLTDWRFFEKLPRFRKKLSVQRKSCYWLYAATTIQWDGAVFPCCYVANKADPDRIFGNIAGENFSDIWNDNQFKAAREFLKMRTCLKDNICARCLTPPVFSAFGEDRDPRVYD